jgi:hypothetical protein|tara:strand:- start:3142 stop:3924 length:783 start_codon:yes stop_codon:yes gene_type:complete
MKIAKVCKEWDLNFNIELKSEEDTSLHSRSYIHYAAQHTELVACKSWATKWLLEDIVDSTKEYNVREYMAGIGVQTCIIQNLFKVKKHIVSELDEGCVEHLSNTNFDPKPEVRFENAQESLMEDDSSNLKFLDLPNSSILQIEKKWKDGFYKLFDSNPELVVWTDTSVTYPMSLHGEKYSKLLSSPSINNKEEYVDSYSKWLYNKFGYSIGRAAFRARNAVYFAAIPGDHKTESKSFPVKETEDGFYFIGEERKTLDSFF